MRRDELEQLDRDALVAKAEEAGVARARVLTRPELVDELLLRSAADVATRQRSRGLFGRARDLIARVVERGLHLPDAAERIRALGLPAPARGETAPAALPTVTLAQIYAAQGHRERAVDTLNKVLVREPEHAVAASLLTKLRDRSYPLPAPVLPPEDEPPVVRPPAPEDRGLDECVAVLVDRATLRVSWGVRAATFEHARRSHPAATLALCILVVRPTWDGPRSTTRRHDVVSPDGSFLVRDLPAGCVVRAAVGCFAGDTFVPFAHSAATETPATLAGDLGPPGPDLRVTGPSHSTSSG